MAENGTNGEGETQETAVGDEEETAAEEEETVEEKETTVDEPEEPRRTSTGSQPDEDTAAAKERGWSSEAECEWETYHKERFETAVFTLATFAAVFAVYIYIVYSLSSSPTVLHRM